MKDLPVGVNYQPFSIPMHNSDFHKLKKEAERYALTPEEYVHSLIMFDIRRLDDLERANKDLTE